MTETTSNNIKTQQTTAPTAPAVKKGYSFYQKLGFLYFLNIIDWICTEVLIASGHFYEANPIMQPVLGSFSSTLLIKGVLPLVMIIICSVVYKLAGEEDYLWANILLYIGIGVYALVNLWHIFNFVLLFSHF